MYCSQNKKEDETMEICSQAQPVYLGQMPKNSFIRPANQQRQMPVQAKNSFIRHRPDPFVAAQPRSTFAKKR